MASQIRYRFLPTIVVLSASIPYLVASQPTRVADPKPQTTAAREQPGRVDLKSLLESKGYKRIPLKRDTLGSLHLKLQLGKAERNAMLDTGATFTIFSERLANELKLDLSAKSIPVDNIGGTVSVKRTRVPKPLATWVFAFPEDVIVYDKFEEKVFASDPDKVGIDILLGMDVLRHYSAIIDVAEPAIYIREPMISDTRLEGEWQYQSYTREGIVYGESAKLGFALSLQKTH